MKKRWERKKKEREKNEKIKQSAINRGRIIKEEHGQKCYSREYCNNTSAVIDNKIIAESRVDVHNRKTFKKYINSIQKYKDIILDLLIYWPRLYNTHVLDLSLVDKNDEIHTGDVVNKLAYYKMLKYINIYYNYYDKGIILAHYDHD